MSMRWRFNLDLLRLHQALSPEALARPLEIVRVEAMNLAPVETGHLVGTAEVHEQNHYRAAVTFDGPYARYQHERLDLHHPHGGQGKFLEQALSDKAGEVLDALAGEVRDGL